MPDSEKVRSGSRNNSTLISSKATFRNVSSNKINSGFRPSGRVGKRKMSMTHAAPGKGECEA